MEEEEAMHGITCSNLGEAEEYDGKAVDRLERNHARLEEARAEVEAERVRLEEERSAYQRMMARLEHTCTRAHARVKLDVGGKVFTTSLDTLRGREQRSFFAAMFSGQWGPDTDADGAFFIDRDGKHFRRVLNYLRTGEMVLPTDEADRRELMLEVEFYQLHDLLLDIANEKKELGSLSPAEEGAFTGSILLMDPTHQRQLGEWGYPQHSQEWTLLYRASRDGATGERFHRLCDDKGPTFVIIRSVEGYLFGGFTTASWTSQRQGYQSDADAFLFTLVNPHHTGPTKYPVAVPTLATYCLPKCGPCFGLDIFLPCTFTYASIKFPKSYADSAPTQFGERTFTGHAEAWRVDDVEVFGISMA